MALYSTFVKKGEIIQDLIATIIHMHFHYDSNLLPED